MESTSSPTLATGLPPAVHFHGVTRRFGSVAALAGVTLRVAPGETVALLGPNGAGKSTAIALLLGLLMPTTGHLDVLGGTPAEAVRAGRVGAMLQDVALPPGARVGELVDVVRATYAAALPRSTVLERAGLERLAGRRVESLSGGEAQRVRFAMAIAGSPDLVFLDEPTVAMDVETRRAFWADIHRAAADGRTILFATHYLDEADQVADRIVVLDRGLVVADGSPADLKAGATTRTIRFAAAEDAGAGSAWAALPGVIAVDRRGSLVALVTRNSDETVRALVAGGIEFRNLEIEGASLDDAFLALTGAAGRAA